MRSYAGQRRRTTATRHSITVQSSCVAASALTGAQWSQYALLRGTLWGTACTRGATTCTRGATTAAGCRAAYTPMHGPMSVAHCHRIFDSAPQEGTNWRAAIGGGC